MYFASSQIESNLTGASRLDYLRNRLAKALAGDFGQLLGLTWSPEIFVANGNGEDTSALLYVTRHGCIDLLCCLFLFCFVPGCSLVTGAL